jgi:hypothetical protein
VDGAAAAQVEAHGGRFQIFLGEQKPVASACTKSFPSGTRKP